MRPIHATCVAIKGQGVLLLGDSGSGKSDLAWRLIDRGAALVADDYVRLRIDNGTLIAAAPPTIAGRIELRGVGILTLPSVPECPLAMAVQLVEPVGVPRLPERQTWAYNDLTVPLFKLTPFELTAPLKVEQALAAIQSHAKAAARAS